jgi:hypothetical protein
VVLASNPLPEDAGSSGNSFSDSATHENGTAWHESKANGKSKTLPKKRAERLEEKSSTIPPNSSNRSVWEELAEIEKQILRPEKKETQHPKGAKGGWSRLKHWLKGEITPAGIVRRDPVHTPSAVLPLARIRQAGSKQGWSKEFEKSFLLVLQAAAQFSRTEGELFHDAVSSSKEAKQILGALSEEKRLKPWSVMLEELRSGKIKGKHARQCELGIECDEAKVGVLRADWDKDAAHVGLDFSSPLCQLDVRLMDRVIFQTPWETRIEIDGDEFSTTSQPWENVGWNEDEFGQYIEVKQEVAEGVTIERVIFVPRHSKMVLLLDVLRASSAAKTRIEWNLASPTVGGISPLGETRARQAEGVDFDLRFLPVAGYSGELEPSCQSISANGGKLRVTAEQKGAAVALPLLVVWDKKSLGPQRIWRPLTVTSDRVPVATHEAFAVRVPHEGKQMVFFRSLVGTRRFAFIGHQTFYETIVGDIDDKGKLTDWLAVDADPDTPWFYSSEETS